MRKQLLFTLTAASTLLFIPDALAAKPINDEGFYLGISVGYPNFDNSVINDSIDGDSYDTLLGGVLGYQFGQYIAIEGRGYGSVTDHYLDIDYHFSALAKVIWPVYPSIKPYLLLGYGDTKSNFISDPATKYDSDSDFIYGVGISFRNNTPLIFAVEWQSFYDETNRGVSAEAYMFNTNIYYKF